MAMLPITDYGSTADTNHQSQMQQATGSIGDVEHRTEELLGGNHERKCPEADGADQAPKRTGETATSLKGLGRDPVYHMVPCIKPETFMDLPYEVRYEIYEMLLRPGAIGYPTSTTWRNGLGCTKVLGLSHAIRAEAVCVLDSMSPALHFYGRGRRVFRNMFAHGTPKMFQSFSQTTSCHIPQALTELAMLRLRRIVIDFRYVPKVRILGGEEYYDGEGREVLSGLQKEMLELGTAVTKSKALVELHFKIQATSCREDYSSQAKQTPEADPIVNDDNQELFNLFIPLINAAGRQGFIITAKENKGAHRHGVYPCYAVQACSENYHDPLVQLINMATITGDGDAQTYSTVSSTFTGKPEASEEDYVRALASVNYPPIEYSLTPECRKCYETFRNKDGLVKHLAAYPKHKIPFTKKRYNELDKKHATTMSWRHKCRVCADCFDTVISMEKHCERWKHYRTREQGIVGRWKRDNGWYCYPGGGHGDVERDGGVVV